MESLEAYSMHGGGSRSRNSNFADGIMDFLNYCEEELAGCLRPESVGTDLLSDRAERAERRLAELGRKAEQRGGRHMGAVWILPVKGEAIWSKGKQSKETVQME